MKDTLNKIDQQVREEEIRKNGAINPNKVADKILKERRLIYSAGEFYEYETGVYVRLSKGTVKKYIKEILHGNYSTHMANEVLDSMATEVFVDVEGLNKTELLNLKNGMFDLETETLLSHDPKYLSTAQLNANYNPGAECIKWLDTLYQIFEKDEYKIQTLQEFFGLCLTKDVSQEKALFMIGEGSNGKSTILYVLEQLLGADNKISIPLEKLNDMHYVASLLNKLVNISIETNVKSEVYDAMFKVVVTGDSITADPKFRHPFTFRPYCKLIYALNNMPRVNDKTHAFFRRLLILRFNKQFSDEEANKTLKRELLEYLDGIFLWFVEGYRNLRKRGYFVIDGHMRAEIDEYKHENNNVMVFVEEECVLDVNFSISKQDLYNAYKQWCNDNNNRSLSKRRFGKEFMKQYRSINEDRAGHERTRTWLGVDLNRYRK